MKFHKYKSFGVISQSRDGKLQGKSLNNFRSPFGNCDIYCGDEILSLSSSLHYRVRLQVLQQKWRERNLRQHRSCTNECAHRANIYFAHKCGRFADRNNNLFPLTLVTRCRCTSNKLSSTLLRNVCCSRYGHTRISGVGPHPAFKLNSYILLL